MDKLFSQSMKEVSVYFHHGLLKGVLGVLFSLPHLKGGGFLFGHLKSVMTIVFRAALCSRRWTCVCLIPAVRANCTELQDLLGILGLNTRYNMLCELNMEMKQTAGQMKCNSWCSWWLQSMIRLLRVKELFIHNCHAMTRLMTQTDYILHFCHQMDPF